MYIYIYSIFYFIVPNFSLVGSGSGMWDGLEKNWPIFLKGSCWAIRNGV